LGSVENLACIYSKIRVFDSHGHVYLAINTIPKKFKKEGNTSKCFLSPQKKTIVFLYMPGVSIPLNFAYFPRYKDYEKKYKEHPVIQR